MISIVEKALKLWDLEGAGFCLIAARENAVYKVTKKAAAVALRLHRTGYRTNQEVWSELQWMAAISAGGIVVPAPIPSTSGELLHIIDGVQVDVLTWLSGEPMTSVLVSLDVAESKSLFKRIGRDMATLHDISDAWTPPRGFTRCCWDRQGLLGDAPLWDCFWNNPHLSEDDRQLFMQFRDRANVELERIEQALDYGLIHADLVHANVLVNGDSLQLIDFDDGGYGFRIFDVTTALLKNLSNSNFLTFKSALIEGYSSVREPDLAALDLFLVLRASTYVGWNITRMGEEGAHERNERFIGTLRHLVRDYMQS